jgi:hypothetical protein
VFHFPIVVVAITAIIVVGVVVFAVAVTIDIIARRRRACRAPWLLIQGIQPKQAKAVSPMAWGWSASPWICVGLPTALLGRHLVKDVVLSEISWC